MSLIYQVSDKLARKWIAAHRILPLLDGLDEVKAEHRAACVTAINTFRQSGDLGLPLVVTCRSGEYEALDVDHKLLLHGAIRVQPMTREQVNAYLADLGPPGESVRAALREDESLWDLLDSPLLLYIVTVACVGRTGPVVATHGTPAERRESLFRSYVDQMFRRRGVERRYTPDQTVCWLGWLAKQMVKHDQTVFYLERLQNTWLAERQGWVVRVCSRLASGLVGTLVGGLIGGLPYALVVGQDYGVYVWVGLAFGLIGGLVLLPSTQDISCVETIRWSWSQFWHSLLPKLLGALLFGLRGGLVIGLISGLIWGLSVGLTWGLIAPGLRAGLTLGLLVGLIFVPIVGLIGVLAVGLRGGLVGGEIETKTVPNQGVRRSVRNGLYVGFVSALAFGLVSWLIFGVYHGLRKGPHFGVIEGLGWGLHVGLMVGLGSGLHAGGGVFLKHVILRLALIRNGSTPWHYVRFLDYAAERILLRKVGGGYVFLHRMLMEHFADQYGREKGTG